MEKRKTDQRRARTDEVNKWWREEENGYKGRTKLQEANHDHTILNTRTNDIPGLWEIIQYM